MCGGHELLSKTTLLDGHTSDVYGTVRAGVRCPFVLFQIATSIITVLCSTVEQVTV